MSPPDCLRPQAEDPCLAPDPSEDGLLSGLDTEGEFRPAQNEVIFVDTAHDSGGDSDSATRRQTLGGATVLVLQGDLTIYRAEQIKAALLADPAPREVDLSGVTDIDTAGLQLLMLAKKQAQAQGRELRLVAHSPVVSDLFELLSIAAFFGDPVGGPWPDAAAAAAKQLATADVTRCPRES